MLTVLFYLFIANIVLWILAYFLRGLMPVFSLIAFTRRKGLNRGAIEQLAHARDFNADDIWVSPAGPFTGLAIDQGRGMLMLISGRVQNPIYRLVKFSQIVSSEIKEDNLNLITTQRRLGGIVVGGLLAGEVGAIAGAVLAPKRSTATASVRKLALSVVIDDLAKPNYEFTLLQCLPNQVIDKNSPDYRSALECAQLWHSRLTVAMRRAQEAGSTAGQPLMGGQLSTAANSSPAETASTAPTAVIAGRPSAALVGQRYRVVKQIGGGAMKKVFLAEDMRLGGRRCALAEMVDMFSTGDARDQAVSAFQRECHLLATVDDPHIPKVLDYFSEQERHFLVMDFVEGVTLERLLASSGGAFNEGIVVAITLEVLATLAYLHGLNPPVIYRDLKPSNIMVTQTGGIKLVDFGIARVFQPSKTMTMIGTQGYAAPEQYKGQVEPRSDLYALGAVMHQALTARDPALQPPFSFPPLGELRPDVMPGLLGCVDQALSYDPAGRPGSAAEMTERLLQIPHAALSSLAALVQACHAEVFDLAPTENKTSTSDTVKPETAAKQQRPWRYCPKCGTAMLEANSECTKCEGPKTSSRPEHAVTGAATDIRAAHAASAPKTWRAGLILVAGIPVVAGLIALLISVIGSSSGTNESAPQDASAASPRPTVAGLSESEKASRESELLNKARHLPESERAGNLQIYRELSDLRPNNATYRSKLEKYQHALREFLSKRTLPCAPDSYRIVESRASIRVIVVAPACDNLDSMKALGDKLRSEFAAEPSVIAMIFDDRRAASMYDRMLDAGGSLGSKENHFYDKHTVGNYTKNVNTGLDQFLWNCGISYDPANCFSNP